MADLMQSDFKKSALMVGLLCTIDYRVRLWCKHLTFALLSAFSGLACSSLLACFGNALGLEHLVCVAATVLGSGACSIQGLNADIWLRPTCFTWFPRYQ